MNNNYDNLIIDSMNIAYKIFYKMPSLTNIKGDETSSIYGFVRLLNSTFNKFKPKNIVLTWDSKNSLRKKIDSNYKIKRFKEPDENLINFIKQIITLRISLKEIGIPTFYKDGYESDDMIAIAIYKYPKEQRHLIYSSDNDMYQLLDDNVDIFNGEVIITKAWFTNKYGFEPRMYVIFKAITGCNSDNVIGIPGIGEKKAIKILKECDYDVEKIYNKIDNLGHTKEFNKALRLVALPLDLNYFDNTTVGNITTYPEPFSLSDKFYAKINIPKLVYFLYEYNIRSIKVKDFLTVFHQPIRT